MYRVYGEYKNFRHNVRIKQSPWIHKHKITIGYNTYHSQVYRGLKATTHQEHRRTSRLRQSRTYHRYQALHLGRGWCTFAKKQWQPSRFLWME